MNSMSSAAGEGETSFEGKPAMGRSRSGARTKLSNGFSSDQPPINLFMNSEKNGKGEQKENDDEDAQCATKDIPKTSSSATPETKESPPRVSENGTEQPSKSQAEQAAKLDIKLSPEIILFMKSVCLRHPNSRTQADMTLLKMIVDFNPQLRESDKPLIWFRMQKSLTQMAVKVQEEMAELQRQREAAAAAQAAAQAAATAQAAAASAAAVAAQRAAFAAANAQRQQFFEQFKRQQAEMARHREQMARDREMREQNYNKQLYNAVHRASSLTNLRPEPDANRQSPQPQSRQILSGEQWDNLRQSILQQIGLNDKDAPTLVRFIYRNFPPKGKIRINEEAIAQMPQLQRKFDPDSKKKLKMMLLKVIQDYHPDKVNEEHGEKWKTISEDIVKRVNKYHDALK